MDLEAYIQSGILESYATGVASPQERREVECLSNIYPEIATELADIQVSLETFALSHQEGAPEGLKSNIMAQINKTEQLPPENLSIARDTKEETDIEKQEPPLHAKQGTKNRYWMAASIALALALGSMAVWNSSRTKNLENQLQDLNQQMVAQEVQLNNAQNRIQLLARPGNVYLALQGTEKCPQAQAQILWNKKENSVHIIPKKLQPLKENQDYQLWAIDAEGPKSLGVIPTTAQKSLIAMQGTENSQAFAITIEPKNGSTKPTLEQMVVLGKVDGQS